MKDNIQYYLNQGDSCSNISTKDKSSLKKENHLSEFKTLASKQAARNNLGISDIVKDLSDKVDAKTMSKDLVSILQHLDPEDIQNVVSSAGIYEYLKDYISKEDLDKKMQEFWIGLVSRIQEVEEKIDPSSNESFEQRIKSLELQVATFLQSVAGGTALTNRFGNSDYIGISQKTLTDAFNRVWTKLSEITGEDNSGFSFVVNPPYYMGKGSYTVHVIATTENMSGVFETLELYVNDRRVLSREDVENLEYDLILSGTNVLTCKATILGIEYTQSRTITQYDQFWIGAGKKYEDVMILQNAVSLHGGESGNYDITFNQGDYLFVIVGTSVKDGFYRADMNGMEIPLNNEGTINDGSYTVFKSINSYNAGTYNIDINS